MEGGAYLSAESLDGIQIQGTLECPLLWVQQEREQLSSPADPHSHVVPASGLCSEVLKP